MMPRLPSRLLPLLALFALPAAPAAGPDAEALFQKHCAECHGPDRLGRMGPALLPQNLGRLKPKQAAKVIENGRAATQMQGFSDKLSGTDAQALVDYIFTPLPEVPEWGLAQIRDSRIQHNPLSALPDQPVFDADPLNLFTVVEVGDHHATIVNGDTFEPIHRFKTRFALHGGPKYSPDGRFIYFCSRDGWVSKFDLYNLKLVAEVRAGINARNLAVSADGETVMVANYLPHTLVALDAADLTPLKVIPAEDKDGKGSRVSAVYTAPPRDAFIAAMKDIPEVWEISYREDPPAGFGDWVHDYRKDSGDGHEKERFPFRRVTLETPLDDFFFDQDYTLVMGASRGQSKGRVVDLDTGHRMATLELPGFPHLASGITWDYEGRRVMATPNIREGEVTIIDMESFETVKQIETQGPGFFMRSHPNSRYAWVDVFFGPHHDKVHVIDKQSLEIVKTLQPAPGKTAAHVEYTRDGRYALLSIWDPDGAVVVYDAETLEEVRRLPMNKPSGKYNVYNKTRYLAGTSH